MCVCVCVYVCVCVWGGVVCLCVKLGVWVCLSSLLWWLRCLRYFTWWSHRCSPSCIACTHTLSYLNYHHIYCLLLRMNSKCILLWMKTETSSIKLYHALAWFTISPCDGPQSGQHGIRPLLFSWAMMYRTTKGTVCKVHLYCQERLFNLTSWNVEITHHVCPIKGKANYQHKPYINQNIETEILWQPYVHHKEKY